ncbi:MAG: hypothetical protein RLZ98_2159 [Pseudomonadota bacterium]|jgi:tripartite-type tricarboxylate transporter receptor subunit TctC
MNNPGISQFGPVALGLAGILLAGPAAAADFSGKTITVEVPAGSGGTYHIYCQTVARHLGDKLPGKPSMIVKNRPGGGGAVSALYMAHKAPRDGTQIAMISPGSITTPLVEKVDFDARKFTWLGSLAARSSAVFVWHEKGVRTIEDLKTKDVKLGSSGFAAGGSVWPRMINYMLGTKMQLVYGYKGGGAMNIAIERKEVDGRWNYRSGFIGVRPEWISKNLIVPIVATGPRDPAMKNVPHLRDLLEDGSPNQKAYDLLAMNFEVGQAYYAPPGLPKETATTLQKSFAAMLKTPELKADLEKRRIDFQPKTAREVEAEIEKGFKTATGEVLEVFRKVFTKQK